MNTFIKVVSIGLLACTVASQAAPLELKTDDALTLKADYFQSNKNSKRGVLMLHQCNYNRSMYDNIGEQLAKQGIHALSLDFRGFGDSVTEEYDAEKLQALPQQERRKAWQVMSASWPQDVQLAYDYLRAKVSKDGIIGVIGASCGGTQAITLAESRPIKAISFFSSGQREENIMRYKSVLANAPTLIIAAEGDGGTFTSAQYLFKYALHENSKLVSYKGKGHGYPLLAQDTHLATSIVNWFDSQLH
ncbi:alpha/beta fold hydrolase [uncultured Paraglaciecola sp.]|uniref:dienelactone hydrolase family protein n=1 Tax=uncultured Paraglaciecola sp. TaxID=1765024 RepID=UPI00262DEFED|nr:alpha/beta fold hydrolase [uncultured Paraglaciecola sp.]